ARGRQALAHNDHAEALRWLDRAHRLVPHDPNAALTLASVCLVSDAAPAETLFAAVTSRFDVSHAWVGLATARLRQGNPAAAAEAVAPALSRHALTPEAAALADQLAPRTGYSGWCGLDRNGTVIVRTSAKVQVRLDGKPLRGARLPANWARRRTVEVLAGTHLLGSPIRLSAVRALAGCVEAGEDGITGWAWHPGDPDTHPVLTVTDAAGRRIGTWIADDEAIEVPDTGPLARPRRIRIPAAWLGSAVGLCHLRGPDGTDLTGSPLDPAAAQRERAAGALRIGALFPASSGRRPAADPAPGALPADIPPPEKPVGANPRRRAVTVVIPVHDGGTVVRACLDSVLASLPEDARILVVDDGSRDPAIVSLLDDLAGNGSVTLLRHGDPSGFPASANAGMRAARGHDVVLLNSDSLVPPRWLARLRDAAYADPAIGTVTPFSNEASILSYPGPAGTNKQPDQETTNRLDRLAARAHGAAVADIPVGVGFCLYIRRDCLEAVGLLRADVFAQGYGEETDFCLRARALGWRNVALPGLFVGHVSGQSFGAAARHLQARNGRAIERLHPGYHALIAKFLAADPLAEARRRIDALQWRGRGRAWRSAVILLTHDDGGGVEQRLAASIRAHAAAGRRPVVLRPSQTADGTPAIAVRDGLEDDLPNLVFRMEAELPALLRLLRGCRPERAEVHHLLGHHPAVHDVITRLGVPYDVHVHDYAWFCPRVVLIGAHGRYCGEPDAAECEACIADNGHYLTEDIGIAALRERSAQFLARAASVAVPSDDAGTRMKRHFPGLSIRIVPHTDDAAALRAAPQAIRRRDAALVCVIGAIGVHKGYDILLACARDAERRNLALR
ncbi:MAG TPA: glycosyltransferase, partial [Rhodopila sp.]|nr:glycosyltransferase [Rhodopila sp.]